MDPANIPLADVQAERVLVDAFASFTEAAGSLERSYRHLHLELQRLRQELERKNRDLASSLEENRRMREMLNRIVEGLPCGVVVADTDDRILLLNTQAQRLLGISKTMPASIQMLPRGVTALLDQARQSVQEQECQLALQPGEVRWLAARHAGLEGKEHGRQSVFIVEDVSERKRLVQEQERLRRQRALAEMSAVLAHEVRNPLGSLELFAGLLAGSDLREEPRQWVEHLQAGLRMLAATVNNVLRFHNAPPPQMVSIELGSLLDWAGNFLQPLARRSRVELTVRNRLQGVWMDADRHGLEQVLLNLALNALHAMPQGGALEFVGHVAETGADQLIEIEVADDGPGIAADQVDRLFEPGCSTRPGSPGLGLAVCRTIVEQHRGTIEMEGNRLRGARFVVRFLRKGGV